MAQVSVAVIGAGFSGVMCAIHLLRALPSGRIHLIEKSPTFGQGSAYASAHPDHLLNVRAANMSAFPSEPDHFVDWLTARGRPRDKSFAPRAEYGEYLQSLLREAVQTARVRLEADEAVDAAPDGAGWSVSLALGRTLRVDGVVLALGNLPPLTPPGIGLETASPRRYVADPWRSAEALRRAEGAVVLMGAGLTMIDVALSLPKEQVTSILAISRRGLLPLRHADSAPPRADPPPSGPLSSMVRRLRERAVQGDWRPVIDGLRPHVQTIWRGWSAAERARFMRHGRPYWDIHRHRLAPAVASKIDHLTACGRLKVEAGRFVRIEGDDAGLTVTWRRRGTNAEQRVRADMLINCLGPNGDLMRANEPLLRRLHEEGFIRPDAQHLGVDVDEASRPIGNAGVYPALFAVGPMTRGAFWEITAVPDIRVQAERCAKALASALARA